MAFKRKAAGALVDIAATLSRRSAGAWVGVDLVRRKLSGVWVVIWKRVALDDISIAHRPPSGSATAGYRLNSSGVAESLEGVTYATVGKWIALGTSDDFECQATITDGLLSSGTTGAWLSLTSSQEWKVTKTSSGVATAALMIEIRRASTGVVRATAFITLEAEHV